MTDATRDGSIKLSTKRVMPVGGSLARHAQVDKYCKCDVRYKGLDTMRQEKFKTWYTKFLWIKSTSLTAYQLWMKVCLLAWPELSLFVDYCFYGRWEIFNLDGHDKEDVEVTLSRLWHPLRSLGDCTVMLVPPEKHGGTSLVKTAWTSSSVTVLLPSLESYGVKIIDVYWHYNPATGALG